MVRWSAATSTASLFSRNRITISPSATVYSAWKEEVRAMLADLSQSGHRDEAKALVKKYADGGSLTDIDPARYPDLVQEVQNCHG